jgi:formylglycine-generating enzyme required for sulfatase activity
MKTKILIILSLLSHLCSFSRKVPAYLPDSVFATPVSSPTVAFQSNQIGMLVPKNAGEWYLVEKRPVEARSFGVKIRKMKPTPDKLFEDCVYFCPIANIENDVNQHVFFNSKSFLHPVYDEEFSRSGSLVPASVRFYLDTSHIFTDINNDLVSDTFPESLVEDYVRPFYFRKYEVTNQEYREFINYVVDSIARTRLGYLLPDGRLNMKVKYDLYSSTVFNSEFALPQNQRFFGRKQIDPRKIVYHFQQKPFGCPTSDLPIYPDTLRWTKDFRFSFNEPMESMYNWHPAYYKYPVLNVNYWQCLAFLEWKTNQLSKSLKGKYKVTCALPSEIEWDYVSTAEKSGDKIAISSGNYLGTSDGSWLTDLMLISDTTRLYKIFDYSELTSNDEQKGEDTIKRTPNTLNRKTINTKPLYSYDEQYAHPQRIASLFYQRTWGDFIYDGAFHTAPALLDAKGVSHSEKKKSRTTKEHKPTMIMYPVFVGLTEM